ncbi:mandelate racemase/muconate lactonizing enzyme family protein [Pontibacterium granulatum]|uniref:mandelate racemase/muconate lactonizing enzyme family protein n=1 Tax=Pontibacterium granulatum TaxID=2036029 RepID=UPI00249ADF6D|nr:mandelate racemase/muconate lactonizing enzyme family protein [Pontibacterium granulatum]MDI3325775.1 mandelate racemase/muconate lactonizing enzyme family protein [Pontibacterium granulatum]
MKITAIKATPINIPLEAPFWWTGGYYPGTSKTIIEVETDEGIIGLGEAPSVDVVHAIEAMGQRLIGLDPLDIAACEAVCVPPWQIVQNTDDSSVVKAFGAIEIALWDIRGKHWDQPLYKLLGGAVRKEIPFTEYFAFRPEVNGKGGEMSPEAVADYCLRMKEEHGSTYFEGKLILGDPQKEIATVKKLRETLGEDAMIRLDSNMQWSLSTARYVLGAIEEYNIRNYEDPVATFEEMAQLRQHSTIPFSTHVPDIRRAVALGAPDNVVTNFAVLGGISHAIRFIGACEAMGVGFWCYSGDAGICTAAYLHMTAAMPWIHEPSQSLFRWQICDVIEGGPFKQKNNVVLVPEGPGLGVTLDREALAYWHRHFVENGPLDHFYNPAAPGKFNRLPLN